MSETIQVSVLIPVYNVEQHIEKCARTLFSQQVEDEIEFIFVNDCSSDNSIAKLEKVIVQFPNRKNQIRIIHHRHNMGIGKTRMTAVQNATGKYIFMVDSDDWLLYDDSISSILNLANSSNADIVEANYKMIWPDHETHCTISRNASSNKRLAYDIIKKKTSRTLWNKLIKKELFYKIPGLLSLDINNGEDYVILPQLMYYANKVVLLDKETYAYNQLNKCAFSANKKNKANLLSMLDANRKLYDFFNGKDLILAKAVDEMYMETKAYLLLYSANRSELNLARDITPPTDISKLFRIRWKYAVVLILNAIKIDPIILFLGKKFRH